MGTLSVDPGQLRQAVAESKRAVAGLEEARTRLDWANGQVQDAVHDGKVDDRFSGFRKRWKDEFQIISEFLGGMEKALNSAADIYESVESDIANAMAPPPG